MKCDIVIKNNSYEDTYFDAIKNNNLKTVKFLLEHKFVLPQLKSKFAYNGGTGLHAAVVEKNREKMIMLLRKYKVQLNTYDVFGLTPLHNAILMKQLRNARVLLELGANINLRTKDDTKRDCIELLFSYDINNQAVWIDMFIAHNMKIDIERILSRYEGHIRAKKNYLEILNMLTDPNKYKLKKKLDVENMKVVNNSEIL